MNLNVLNKKNGQIQFEVPLPPIYLAYIQIHQALGCNAFILCTLSSEISAYYQNLHSLSTKLGCSPYNYIHSETYFLAFCNSIFSFYFFFSNQKQTPSLLQETSLVSHTL
jgi:hypothetical protein